MSKQIANPPYETLADYLEQTLQAQRNIQICAENCPIIDMLRHIDTNDLLKNFRSQPKDTTWHLHNLGHNPKFAGYRCLLAAIPLLTNDSSLLMKEIYLEIMHQCNYYDTRNMERAIRTAIRDAWERRDPKIWSHYFPSDTDGYIKKPTIKQFIYRLAEEIE